MADPQKEKRRLKLAKRQLTLAQIARSEAMAALADAVDEEVRSAGLAQRSQDLLSEYGARVHAENGNALRSNAAFVSRLQEVADQADKARKDAGDQAEWQVQNLAAAETRTTRFEESLMLASRALEETEQKREQSASTGMARKLQGAMRPDSDDPE